MTLHLDQSRFQLEAAGSHEWLVLYSNLPVMIQVFDHPACEITRQRAIETATRLLQYRWSRMSAHERLEMLIAMGEESRCGSTPT